MDEVWLGTISEDHQWREKSESDTKTREVGAIFLGTMGSDDESQSEREGVTASSTNILTSQKQTHLGAMHVTENPRSYLIQGPESNQGGSKFLVPHHLHHFLRDFPDVSS